MTLWTPYAEQSALDLTKVSVKEERLSPEPSPNSTLCCAEVEYRGVNFQQCYPNVYPQYDKPGPYVVGYPYPHHVSYTAPLGQLSPLSGSSGYEKNLHRLPRPSLSPPESPESLSEDRRYLAEVESLSDDPDFQTFERNALQAMAEKNGGALVGNNPRMRRSVRSTNQSVADDLYRKQRERNNFAAKQSRDRRKLREIHLALKVSYLRNEMTKLKAVLSSRMCVRCSRQ